MLSAILLNLFRGQFCTLYRKNECLKRHVANRIFDANYRSFCAQRMLFENLLDFTSRDILSGALYHVRLSINEVEPAIIVLVTLIARLQPTISAEGLFCCLGVVQVFEHQGPPANALDLNLARLTVRKLIVVLVGNTNLIAQASTANRRPHAFANRWISQYPTDAFGRAIGIHDLNVKALLKGFLLFIGNADEVQSFTYAMVLFFRINLLKHYRTKHHGNELDNRGTIVPYLLPETMS